MPITPEGENLANLADEAHEQAFWTHTSAVTEFNGEIYVTTNGGASNAIRADVKKWADNKGFNYLDNEYSVNPKLPKERPPSSLTNDHAEQYLYHYFSSKGGVDIIGVSGSPCPSCQSFFTPERGVQIVYNKKN